MSTIHTGIHERLRRLQRLMRRHHVDARNASGPLADTTRGQGRVLAALQMQSPIPTRELAYLLDIRQQSLNELLKKLQADGLVERTPHPEDRRVMLVALTDAGRQAELGDAGTDYLAALTQEEAAAFSALLDKVITSLESQLGVAADDDLDAWHAEARRRMGDERFEKMMRMREHGFGAGPFDRHEGHPHGRGKGHGRRGGHGRPGGRGRGGAGGPVPEEEVREYRHPRDGRGRHGLHW